MSERRWDPRTHLLLLLVLFFLGTQLTVLRWGAEPYPAIIMPGFPSIGGPPTGKVALTTLEVSIRFSSGEVRAMPLDCLLDPLPESAYFALLAHFRPRPLRDERTTSAFSERLLPGREIRARRLMEPPYHDRTRSWLRDRAKACLTGEEPQSAEFRWYRTTFDPPNPEPVGREPAGLVQVRLEP